MTARQSELLAFLHARQVAGGPMPSFDEMKAAMSLQSKSGVARMLTCLEEQGFIRRTRERARRVEVLRLPGRAVLSADERDWCEQNAGLVRVLIEQHQAVAG